MKQCKKCGHWIPDGDYCERCGSCLREDSTFRKELRIKSTLRSKKQSSQYYAEPSREKQGTYNNYRENNCWSGNDRSNNRTDQNIASPKQHGSPIFLLAALTIATLIITLLASAFRSGNSGNSTLSDTTPKKSHVTQSENKVQSSSMGVIPANPVTLCAGGFHVVGLQEDGTVIASGDNSYGQCNVQSWNNIVSVSANSYCTYGLKSDGTVIAAGLSDNGQCDVSDWRNIISISAGSAHIVGLRKDGTVVATGITNDDLSEISTWQNIIAISAGYSHIAGLKEDGTVIIAGYVEGAENISTWKDITAITSGFSYTAGLKSDGSVVTGWDGAGGLFNASYWTQMAAISGGSFQILGLKKDGKVAVAPEEDILKDIWQWRDVAAVATCVGDGCFAVALKKDGTVLFAGHNFYNIDVSKWRNIRLP